MDTLVFNKFDLQKTELNMGLEKELSRIKNEAAGRGAYSSSGCAHQMCDAITNNCKDILDSLLNTYKDMNNITPGFIVKNEGVIRNEVNEQLASEYKVCENRILGIFNEFKLRTNLDIYTGISREVQTKLNILIETAKRTKNPSPDESKTEKEYNILTEKFECKEPLASGVENKCFVIMPIGDKDESPTEYKNNMDVFSKIVKPCVENSRHKIVCYHADDELVTKTGDISKHIFKSIQDDVVAIVDLRRQNPNVIYEMCIRHVFGGRTILICSDFKQNFFHNTKYRAIKYYINGKSNQEFYRRMQAAIDDLITSPNLSDNPIKDWLGLTQGQPDNVDKLSSVAEGVLKECLKRDISDFYESEMISYMPCSRIETEAAFDDLREGGLIIQTRCVTDENGAVYSLTPEGKRVLLGLKGSLGKLTI